MRRRTLAIGLATGLLLSTGCRDTGADATPTTVVPPASLTTTTGPSATTTLAPSTSATAPPKVDELVPPEAAATPSGLAAQITAAERTLRDASVGELETADAALAQQVAYRQLGRHPEWDDAVLAAVPADLRPPVELNAAARREFAGMHSRLTSTLPAWRIVAPEPPDELMAAYRDAEAAFGIPWRYLAAVHLVETGMGRIRGTSTAGAQGPMQFLPSTWARYGAGGDIDDTHDAVMGAARYLAANGGVTDIDHALHRYNNSDRYVRGVRFYADLIVEHPRAFLAYYHWGIWYATDQGDVYLPVGYAEAEPVPATDQLGR